MIDLDGFITLLIQTIFLSFGLVYVFFDLDDLIHLKTRLPKLLEKSGMSMIPMSYVRIVLYISYTVTALVSILVAYYLYEVINKDKVSVIFIFCESIFWYFTYGKIKRKLEN